MRTVSLGMLGLGTVGSGVVQALRQQQSILQARTGFRLEIKKIVVRDPNKARAVDVDRALLSTNPQEVLNDPDIQMIVEVMGGCEPARTLVLQAFEQGKHIVTANKALLAVHGPEIFGVAHTRHVDLGFEAAVGGGIPIIRALREGFVANNFTEIYGILNGTTNYILTEMTEKGEAFSNVLTRAQQLGLAEPDPSFDIEGTDAAHKIAILAYLGFGHAVGLEHIFIQGIQDIQARDILFAGELGYTVKLLAIVKHHDHALEVRVHPTMIPRHHLLATVNGSFNAVYVNGDVVGPTMFYGQGAGMLPTASAVLSDVVDISRNMTHSAANRVPLQYLSQHHPCHLHTPDHFASRYYFRFTVVDQYGVLAAIAGILSKHQISIASVIQKEVHPVEGVPIVMLTYTASEHNMRQALAEIDALDIVLKPTVVIRVLTSS